jgi:type I restriction enzyme S subunit
MSNKVKLSEIAYIKMGQSPSGETCNEIGNGIALLNGPAEFTSYNPLPKQYTIDGKRFSEKGDILFCVRGSTTGRMNWADQKYALGRGLASISHKKGNEYNHFLKFLLQSNLKSLLNAANGSTFPNLTSDILASFELSVPEEKTQKTISFFLQNIDSKIELNNRINAELEAMAKTLYDFWFVQFDFPFDFAQGKPNANGKPYKSSGGKMVWNEELKREIPDGWEVKNLYSIANYINGLACQKYRPKSDSDVFLPVIKIKEMNDGISTNTEKAKIDIPMKYIIDDGDVLFSWSATLDVKIWTEGRGALNQHIFKIESELYPRTFYYFELLNYLQHFKMMAELRKTTMGHITIDHLKTSYISIPPLELIKNLDKLINPIIEKVIMHKKENQKLASLRDWLLPMLMNGQVKVMGDLEE